MTTPLTKLIDDCLAGDQGAMLELVGVYQARVFGLCFRMLGHRQDAEDAAQETFVRALRSLAGFDRQREFEPWLLTIAANRCRTAMAKRGRQPALTPLVEHFAEDASPNHRSVGQLAEEVELALRGMREEYREAFLLFHEQELNYEEIAETLQRPLGTVKTWIHRARRDLIERLRQRGTILERRDEVRAIRTATP